MMIDSVGDDAFRIRSRSDSEEEPHTSSFIYSTSRLSQENRVIADIAAKGHPPRPSPTHQRKSSSTNCQVGAHFTYCDDDR